MKRLKLKDIPSDLLAKIDEQFNQHPSVRQMRIQQNELMRKRMFQAAMRIGEKIEILHTRTIDEYLKAAENEASDTTLQSIGMSREDEEYMRTAEFALFMACDVINCCLIDMNDTLHRYDKTINYERFNDMRQLIDMVKAKLNYLRQNSSYLQNEKWGDLCDNAYKMLMSKAKRMIQEERKKNSKK